MKKFVSLLLALALCLGLAGPALAAEALPDWYFLFAAFKNIDADGKDKDGDAVHVTYSMSQEEIDVIRGNAEEFEEYMNSIGVMRAHVDVVEIDETVTELAGATGGSWLTAALAEPFLEKKVDLDRYDHVTCIVCLDNLTASWMGLTGAPFENGTGQSCINYRNRENTLNHFATGKSTWPIGAHVHEFLHFMEGMTKKFGAKFGLHDVRLNHYMPDGDGGNGCYRDIMLNQARGTAGTGVAPATWQYPPHVLRTMTELTVPSGVTAIGGWGFQDKNKLTKLTIPSSVTTISYNAFGDCDSLAEVTIQPGLTTLEGWAFGKCPALTKVTIPASVTSIGECAFYQTGLKDVYYGGTEAQWNGIQMGDFNGALTGAAIHYNSVGFADVAPDAYYANPVLWAVEEDITNGTGGTTFSPAQTCNQAQILTFLWRAQGEPKPAGDVVGTAYYDAAAQWAHERELLDDFGPDDPCTRLMVVTYLWKLAGSPAASGAGFTDVPAGDAQAVAWAVEQGITNGTGGGKFSPDKTCNRGEIVTFLCRAMAD